MSFERPTEGRPRVIAKASRDFAGAAKTMLKDFFESNDTNKDGKITREEWDAAIKFMSLSKNSAFALKAGGTGEVSKTHMLVCPV